MKIPDLLHKILITFFTAVYSVIIGYIAAMLILSPEYLSTSRCYVAEKKVTSESSQSDNSISDNNFLYFINSTGYHQTLSRSVDNAYTADEIKKMLSVSRVDDTGFYDITVKAPTASDSYQLQIMISDSLGKYVSAKSGYTISVSFTEQATVPSSESRLRYILIAAVTAVIGAAVSILIQIKRSSKNPDVLTEQNISEYLSYPVFGKIPDLSYVSATRRRKKSDISAQKSIIKINNDSPPVFRRAFSELFTAVKFGSDNPCCVISVCSAVNGEGKTSTAVNLAITASNEKMKVLIVDCNFHDNKLNEYFDIDYDHPGISDILLKNFKINNALTLTNYNSLYVLCAGTSLNDSRAAFSGRGISMVINQLKPMFDFIIIDTPPLNTFPDANIPISISDVTLLTVRSGLTSPDDIQILSDHLRLSGNDADGIVINMISEESEQTFVTQKKSRN